MRRRKDEVIIYYVSPSLQLQVFIMYIRGGGKAPKRRGGSFRGTGNEKLFFVFLFFSLFFLLWKTRPRVFGAAFKKTFE